MARNAQASNGQVDLAALKTEAVLSQAQGLLNPAQLAELQRVAARVQEQSKAERERNMAPAASFRSPGR